MNSVIVKQLNTEKTHSANRSDVYVFLCQRNVRKQDVKIAVEKEYSVKVVSVNLLNMPKRIKYFRGKFGCLSQRKKAYVRLEHGMKIENVVKEG